VAAAEEEEEEEAAAAAAAAEMELLAAVAMSAVSSATIGSEAARKRAPSNVRQLARPVPGMVSFGTKVGGFASAKAVARAESRTASSVDLTLSILIMHALVQS
jgi:hypothetical protein